MYIIYYVYFYRSAVTFVEVLHTVLELGQSLQDSQAGVCLISSVIGAEPAQFVHVPNGGVARSHQLM